MISRDSTGLWLELHENVSLHHDEAFALLTTEDGLSRWLAVGATIDTLEQGGTVTLAWDRKLAKTNTVAILEYSAGGTVTWDWYASWDDIHAPVRWTVTPDREKGSRIALRQGPFADTLDGALALAEQASNWQWYLCNMRSVIEARHDMRAVRPL
jgi:uncharacterized protein YndB with AHSA1/START domain